VTPTTILLIDDDDDFLQMLRERCSAIGLRVEYAHNLLTATMIVSKRVPDIICVDVEMPTGSGLAFCEGLAVDPATSTIPVVVLTGKSSPEARRVCERLRAHYVQKTATNFWPPLESTIRQLVAETVSNRTQYGNDANEPGQSNGASATLPESACMADFDDAPAKTIVVADDDQDMLQLLSQRFSSLGCSVIGIDNALEAINVISRHKPDLVCIDVGMPSGSGLSVCEMMASDEQLRKIPIIVLTGRSDGETIRRCHDMLVYYVQKSADTWERIAPLACELIDLHKPALAT
jgi:CheY-like chemotaxis protein